jgi:hypothetical protein
MDGIKASPGKWLVLHGTHEGTITSRDTERNEYDSEAEARKEFAQAKQKYWDMFRRVTWYAHMYDDEGNMTVLDAGRPYRR